MERPTTPQARRTDCRFCGQELPPKRVKGRGKADEHIIPQWLIEHLGLTDMPVTGTRWDGPAHQALETRQHPVRNFVSGGICAACNSGWMSDLESEARPIIVRLIASPQELSNLSEGERRLVVRWTFKTAAAVNIASFGDPRNPLDRPIPDEHLRPLPSGGLPNEVVTFGAGCPSDRISDFMQNASWGVPKHSVPLLTEDRERSYKIGMSFRSLLLGVAYYPNREYLYGVPQRTHLLLWCSHRDVVRPLDDMAEVPIVANTPVLEGFLANVFVVSRARWQLMQNEETTRLLIQPRVRRWPSSWSGK